MELTAEQRKFIRLAEKIVGMIELSTMVDDCPSIEMNEEVTKMIDEALEFCEENGL